MPGLDRARPHDATSVLCRVGSLHDPDRRASAGGGARATFQGQNVSGAGWPGKRTLSVMEWEGVI